MKRKSNVDGVSTSKTARASMGKGKDDGFKASGDMKRIIPLNNGNHAYLLDPRTGRTHHLAVGSPMWNTLIEELAATDYGSGIQKELEELGWTVKSED